MASRVRSVLDGGELSIVYQPIYHFEQDRIIGFGDVAQPIATAREALLLNPRIAEAESSAS